MVVMVVCGLLLLLGVVAVVRWGADEVGSHKTLVGGRIALAGIALLALPGFVSAVADIAGRGP